MEEGLLVVTTVEVSDVDAGEMLSYAITGGADDELFSIDGSGVLSFITAPGFANPGDVGGNNVYDVEVTVTDSQGATDSQSLAVTVTPNDGIETVSVFALEDLDGTNGFVLNGVDPYDRSGAFVLGAGDVNGDGFDDFLVMASEGGAEGYGEMYVVFGKAGGWAGSFELSSLAAGGGSAGFLINGVADDNGRHSISDAGDVNGDGFDDLLVGVAAGDPNGNNNSGESYVIFGKGAGWAGSFELSSLVAGDGSTGFVLNGVDAYDRSGISVSSAGDVNGDGFDDLLIGAAAGDPNGNDGSGESYVIFGKASGWLGNFELSTLSEGDGSMGFVLNGVHAGDMSGDSVSSAGDVNGDGFDDLLIGARRADPNGSGSGESYVVFGKASGWSGSFDLSSLSGSDGFVLNGISLFDRSSISVSSGGDVNGDGFDDLLLRASQADSFGNNDSGESYVVFGKASGWEASFELASLVAGDGSIGFVINGMEGGSSGVSISSAGDVNGDGFDDLLVGAALGDLNGFRSGESYVIFGKASGWEGNFELSSLVAGDGSIGLVLTGQAGEPELGGELSGNSVSIAGDVNGDGFDDLLIGAPEANPNNTHSGRSYVMFGRDFTQQIDENGTAGADYLVGSALNDTLTGLGGADVLNGGAGDDVLVVSDLNFNQIDGGNGEDTLRLDGSNLGLDLTAIPDMRLQDLEVIDLNGNSNTLTVTKLEVLNLSTQSNTLRVMGSGMNAVNFSGFTADGSTVINSVTYNVYTAGEATLQLQTGLTLNISPVVIDLNRDGVIDYQALGEDGVQFDADGNGQTESVAWVGPEDGFLVFDANGDQMVNDRSELALSDYAEGARTDLEGLSQAFDSDGNGRFDANDNDWNRFGVWQDKDQDGVTDEGEFFTMEEAGIEVIDLASVTGDVDASGMREALMQTNPVEGVTVFGETQVLFTDGTTGLAEDVGLGFRLGGDDVALDLAGMLDLANEGSEEDQALVAGIETLGSDEEECETGEEAGLAEAGATEVAEIYMPEGVGQEGSVLDMVDEEALVA